MPPVSSGAVVVNDSFPRRRRRRGARAVASVASVLAALGCASSPGAARPAASGASPGGAGGKDWIWWEAEAPAATNFSSRNPFEPPDPHSAAGLSGGAWIGAYEPGQILFLEYDVAVPQAREYRFYARKFWRHGPFRWRVDDQPWRVVGADAVLLDAVEIAKGLSASWVSGGGVKLGAGKHRVRIELLEPNATVAFDCFVLAAGPFVARGRLKPGEKYGNADVPAGWFAFEPDSDPFSAAARLDLRWLNEARAGDGGFIQARGDAFVHEKTGKPERFWAVNVSGDVLGSDAADLGRYARMLAKFGVNMVRLHAPLWSGKDFARVDPTKLEGLHRLVAALKQEGIYLGLSSYYPVWLNAGGVACFDGYEGDQRPFAASFFNPCVQAAQRGWWRTVLTSRNPKTGVPLGQDPALAFIEVVNEDSIFFWTFKPYQSVPAPQMQILERRFGAWLRARRDPSLARTFARWGGGPVQGDDEAGGRAGVMLPFEILRRRDARARDTLEFLAELQRAYFDDAYRFVKQELGWKGSVTGSNWITADARVLGPLDKWSNAGCDFIDRHGYFDPVHEGPRAASAITAGDRYDDALALRFESNKPGVISFGLPIMDLAYNGKPSTLSEVNWPSPNRYRTDMPLLAAAYAALQGTDGLFFFATDGGGWAQRLAKFTIANPAALGQFPAAALLYRRGLVKTADVVAHVEADLPGLYAFKGLSVPDDAPGVDGGAMLDAAPPPSASGPTLDPLAPLAGRVEVNVAAKAGGSSKTKDLSAFIDRNARIVRSVTGELRWDWGRGVMTVDAPAAAGATGLLGQAGELALTAVHISSGNLYGAVLVVAMDGNPLASSAKILVQVMTEDANSGWSAPGSGPREIVDVGGPPLVVREIAGRIRFKRPDAASLRVTPLDPNGYAAAATTPLGPKGELQLRPRTLHYLIEK